MCCKEKEHLEFNFCCQPDFEFWACSDVRASHPALVTRFQKVKRILLKSFWHNVKLSKQNIRKWSKISQKTASVFLSQTIFDSVLSISRQKCCQSPSLSLKFAWHCSFEAPKMGKNKISHFFKVTFQKVFPCLAQSAPPPDLPTLHSVCWAQIKELENAAE